MSSKANNTRDTATGSMSKSNENGPTDISSSARKNFILRHEQASSSFQEFLDEENRALDDFMRRSKEAKQKIEKYSKAYGDIEKTMDNLSNLQLLVGSKTTELQKKNAEIEHLNSVRQTMHQDYLNGYDNWKRQLNERQAKIEELKLSSEEANARAAAAESTQARLNQRVTQLEDTGRRASKTEQKLRKEEDKCRELQRQLDQSADRLREWDEYNSVLEDIDLASFRNQLSDLFKRFCEIIRSHFLVDLPAKLLNDHTQWDKVTGSLCVPLALPPRNSEVAKRARMIAALHIVATYVHKNIFKPCFIPNSAAASQGLRDILVRLFREDPRKEATARALLCFTDANVNVDGEIKRTVEATSSDIITLLQPFLGNNGERFRAEFDRFLHDAACLWKLAQRSKRKIDASIDDRDFDKCDWCYLEEFGEMPPEGAENTSVVYDFNMLSLFPCIYVPEIEEDSILHAGFALWPEQPTVAAAEHEHRECMTERRRQSGWGPAGAGLSTKRRRPTIENGGPGSMGGTLTSSNTKGASFLERAIQVAKQKVEVPNGDRGG